MAYRAIVLSSEPATNGNVHVAMQIESDRSGTWEQTSIGRRTLIIPADEILAITGSKLSLAKRRVAVKALFVKKIKALKIGESDAANEQLSALVYQGWPQTVEL